MDNKIFQLKKEGLSNDERTNALDNFAQYIDTQANHWLGYQNIPKFNYNDDIKRFLNNHLNNIGDPFVSGNCTINSKSMEKAVLDYYAKLWNAKTPHNPHDPESYWGYVLTMGSTEGNLYGLWNARDYLKGRKLLTDQNEGSKSETHRTHYLRAIPKEENLNAYRPVAFFSEDTHYSIIKAMRVLRIPTFYEVGKKHYPTHNPLSKSGKWTHDFYEVPSLKGKNGPGSIDVEKLAVLVNFFASKGHPILICCNYGTTFKGAYDEVKAIGERLMPIFKKNGLIDRKVVYDEEGHTDTRNGFWIHVDGALGAAYMPFLEMAYMQGKIDSSGPVFDFRLPWVNSIVMSGHKWIGTPFPCGIFMTKVKYQLFPPTAPEYINSPDTTFAGSRNGLSPIILWDFLARNSYEAQINRAIRCESLASYAEEQLKSVRAYHPSLDLMVERTPMALTVRFRKPNENIVFKYSLSCETIIINGVEHHYAHIFTMDAVTKELIDKFINDLRKPDAFETEILKAEEKPSKIRVKKSEKISFSSERNRGWR